MAFPGRMPPGWLQPTPGLLRSARPNTMRHSAVTPGRIHQRQGSSPIQFSHTAGAAASGQARPKPVVVAHHRHAAVPTTSSARSQSPLLCARPAASRQPNRCWPCSTGGSPLTNAPGTLSPPNPPNDQTRLRSRPGGLPWARSLTNFGDVMIAYQVFGRGPAHRGQRTRRRLTWTATGPLTGS